MKKYVLMLAVAVCLAVLQAGAQSPTEETKRYSEKYLRSAGDAAALFGGRMQTNLIGNLESIYLQERGAQRYDSDGIEIFPQPVSPLESFAVGNIVYDGVFYRGVRMRLDLFRDQLAISPPGGLIFGALIDPGRFGYADLRGYRIVRFPAPTRPDDLPEGYYLQLSGGDGGGEGAGRRVLKKEVFIFDDNYMEFTGRTIKYYVEDGEGVFRQIRRRKGSVLRLLRDRRAPLDRFIRAEGLDVRHDTERVLPLIVDEYERLNGEGGTL
ncbi:MAG: hypothetical protein LBU97_04255 [Alistipes sp.]|nr:hypothetical protein [Alistipes sp.]